jgi:hypothetical protein
VKGYPAGAAPADRLKLGQQIEHELRQLHRCTDDLPLQCVTCTDIDGVPELFPCPTLRVTRRLIRLQVTR